MAKGWPEFDENHRNMYLNALQIADSILEIYIETSTNKDISTNDYRHMQIVIASDLYREIVKNSKLYPIDNTGREM